MCSAIRCSAWIWSGVQWNIVVGWGNTWRYFRALLAIVFGHMDVPSGFGEEFNGTGRGKGKVREREKKREREREKEATETRPMKMCIVCFNA